jgi:hypothetical protein
MHAFEGEIYYLFKKIAVLRNTIGIFEGVFSGVK